MNSTKTRNMRSMVLRFIGVGLIVVGVLAALIAPLEVVTLYSFVEGGRFHYAGFNFGSLMFANVAIQVVGYYLMAILFIPLGYGHIKLLLWANRITETLLWIWLVAGFPLSLIIFMMLLTSKDLPASSLPFLIFAYLLFYPILPILLLRFYRSSKTKVLFYRSELKSSWWDTIPQPVLVVGGLMIVILAAFQVPLLFNAAFSLFGQLVMKMTGALWIGASSLVLGVLIWGILRQKLWGWWGSVLFFSFHVLSAGITFMRISPQALVDTLHFPEFENEILATVLSNAPISSLHITILIVLPPLATLLLLIVFRRDFNRR